MVVHFKGWVVADDRVQSAGPYRPPIYCDKGSDGEHTAALVDTLVAVVVAVEVAAFIFVISFLLRFLTYHYCIDCISYYCYTLSLSLSPSSKSYFYLPFELSEHKIPS